MGAFFTTIDAVWAEMGTAAAPMLVDVRRRAVIDADERMIPGGRWCECAGAAEWAGRTAKGRAIVVYCAHGHQLSQLAAAAMRADGLDAQALVGGLEAWSGAGLPVLRRGGLPELAPGQSTLWVTRRRPKIDRIACPWLILRFIDPGARFLFVDPDQVLPTADEVGGIAFDIEGARYSHEGTRCTFDMLLARSGIDDPALAEVASIVRGADTGRPQLAPEAAGLLAVSLGISAMAGDDDQEALRLGLQVYDALYAWRRHAAGETHNWPAAVPA